jgi:hypothetical protein
MHSTIAMLHQLVGIMNEFELHKMVEGINGGGAKAVVPYSRVKYHNGELQVFLVMIDQDTEHHLVIGLNVSDDLKLMLDDAIWDNEDPQI